MRGVLTRFPSRDYPTKRHLGRGCLSPSRGRWFNGLAANISDLGRGGKRRATFPAMQKTIVPRAYEFTSTQRPVLGHLLERERRMSVHLHHRLQIVHHRTYINREGRTQ